MVTEETTRRGLHLRPELDSVELAPTFSGT